MMMQEVFTKLRTLQEVLSKKFGVQTNIKEIPKILATKIELLSRLKKTYAEKGEEYQAKIKALDRLRDNAIEAERGRERFEEQMDLIQTQREYEALDKEIKNAGEREQDLRRDLQREEKLLDEMKLNLQKEEVMIQKQEEEVKTEQERIKKQLKEKETELRSLTREEKKITPGLDEEILFKFERIIKNKSGLGIVPIEQGVCTGCHMIMVPQFVNNVRLGDGIRFCPNCSRILFFQESVESSNDIFIQGDAEDEVLQEEETEENDDVELDNDE